MALDLPSTGELGWGSKLNNALSALDGALASLNTAFATLSGLVGELAEDIEGIEPSTPPTWDTLASKPAFIAAGTSAANARATIGAGTSNLAIGTAAGTVPDAATVIRNRSGVPGIWFHEGPGEPVGIVNGEYVIKLDDN